MPAASVLLAWLDRFDIEKIDLPRMNTPDSVAIAQGKRTIAGSRHQLGAGFQNPHQVVCSGKRRHRLESIAPSPCLDRRKVSVGPSFLSRQTGGRSLSVEPCVRQREDAPITLR